MKWIEIEGLKEARPMEIADIKVYDVATRSQFIALLRRHGHLRGFIDGTRNTVYVWDAMAAVHPEISRGLGGVDDHGVPVQLTATQIFLRPHGIGEDNLRLMYREIINTPIVRVLYGGHLPSIAIDDEDDDRTLDGLGWEEAGEHERGSESASYSPDERWSAWRRHWGSY